MSGNHKQSAGRGGKSGSTLTLSWMHCPVREVRAKGVSPGGRQSVREDGVGTPGAVIRELVREHDNPNHRGRSIASGGGRPQHSRGAVGDLVIIGKGEKFSAPFRNKIKGES